mmetsp:Transcript_58518/g.127102  ORF Transcript_58518/g.127102 Transcript_58518/m.127102 type:complete len:437 (+) Transcript_58518:300-1610(+)
MKNRLVGRAGSTKSAARSMKNRLVGLLQVRAPLGAVRRQVAASLGLARLHVAEALHDVVAGEVNAEVQVLGDREVRHARQHLALSVDDLELQGVGLLELDLAVGVEGDLEARSALLHEREALGVRQAVVSQEVAVEVHPHAALEVTGRDEDLRRAGREVHGDGVRPAARSAADLEGVAVAVLEARVAAEAALVRVQHAPHGLVEAHADGVVLEALAGVEVEDEEELAPLEGDDLVALVLDGDVLVVLRFLRVEPLEAVLARLHQLVERVEELVAEVVGIREVPAAAAVLVAPAVRRGREVDPLWVSELVAHEVEVALAAEAEHQEADHLVQSQAAVDAHGVLRALDQAHARVHLRVHEPEGVRLVADDGLVVRLAVGHDLLHVAAVREGVRDPAHVPGVVGALLEELDEHVRNGHGKPVVEAEAAVLHGAAERRHA